MIDVKSRGGAPRQLPEIEFHMPDPPECASRFGHAFSVSSAYGTVRTHPGRNSYVAVEHCRRRGCNAVRRTDGRPESRDAEGNPACRYGVLPPWKMAEMNGYASRRNGGGLRNARGSRGRSGRIFHDSHRNRRQRRGVSAA
ncbi:MAG: hypothetical protein J4F28_02245 [Nitrosopumilaceae archaeon]|nr:hypothetical protein [Nitrosopumilaceae archaeon]